MTGVLVALPFLVLGLAPQVRDIASPGGQGASIEIDVPEFLTLGEPVVLTLRVLNDSDRPIQAHLGFDRVGSLQFDVTGPDGERQSRRPEIVDGGSRVETVVVAPRTAYVQRVVLNEWLTFGLAGRYTLRVRFLGSIDADPSVRIAPSPERTYSLVVLPRDPGRLEELCQFLDRRLDRPQGLPEHREAVKELLWVRDPVAIPYLEAAAAREVSPEFPEALRAIGTPEARQALQRLSRHSTHWVAASAKAALARMK